ncbi:MAG: hypothetical protein AB7O73_05340 [Bacteroidia bacterium]
MKISYRIIISFTGLILCLLILSSCKGKEMEFVYNNGNLFLSDERYGIQSGEIWYDTIIVNYENFQDTVHILESIPIETIKSLGTKSICNFSITDKRSQNLVMDVYSFYLILNRDTIIKVFPLRL